ncbi:hypothetical protein E4P40_25945 [Blastococcus sp. CT_GayMR20]|nr:hypothetical protein E4P40_25945 [Blastococcus sp. CT_GayMR20]
MWHSRPYRTLRFPRTAVAAQGSPETVTTRRQDEPVTLPTDLPVLPFPDQAALEAWLEAEHETAPGLYVKLAKKGSGIPSINWEQMVEVLLCFGWIDGRANRLDDSFYLQRVTPRRRKSVWSQKNVATVERLIAGGRMRPAGLAAVEAAKADGRWERAYAGPATVTLPDDLAAALDAEPAARAAYDALDGTNRYAVLWRVHTAGTPATRAKRIAAAVQMLAEDRRIH